MVKPSRPRLTPEVDTQTTTTHKQSVVLGREHIIDYLHSCGVWVPNDVRIFCRVPGGGDWSNTNLDIGSDTVIEAKWERPGV